MTALSNIIADPSFIVMYLIAFLLLYLGIVKHYEPLLLIPIGFGVLIANFPGGDMGVLQAAEDGTIVKDGVAYNIWEMSLPAIAHDLGLMNFLYYMLIKTGFLPPVIFMGVGALTDFGPMLRNFRCCCTVRHFPRIDLCCADGLHTEGSCQPRYHRWC